MTPRPGSNPSTARAAMPTSGQTVLWLTGLAYVALIGWQALTLPDRVPTHLGPGNDVTRWGSLTSYVVIQLGLGLVLLLTFWGIPRVIHRFPRDFVNLPHKEFWLRADNVPRLKTLLANDFGWIGAGTLVLAMFASYQMGQAARGVPLTPAWVFWTIFAVYLICVIGWSIRLSQGPRYRPPRH